MEHNVPALVSVIVPSYNRAKQLITALESIKMQTYRPIEIIIVDDASSDNTQNLLKSFDFDTLAVHIVKNTKNLGVISSRNIALNIAQGTYICFLDSDDYWISNEKINKQIQYLINNIKEIAVGCLWINEFGPSTAPQNYQAFLQKSLFKNPLHIGTLCVRNSVLKENNVYFGEHWCEDYDFVLKLGSIGPIYALPFFGLFYHNNISGRYLMNSFKCNLNCLHLVFKYRHFYGFWFFALLYRICKMFIKLPMWALLKIKQFN